jgi:hypothetical protein
MEASPACETLGTPISGLASAPRARSPSACETLGTPISGLASAPRARSPSAGETLGTPISGLASPDASVPPLIRSRAVWTDSSAHPRHTKRNGMAGTPATPGDENGARQAAVRNEPNPKNGHFSGQPIRSIFERTQSHFRTLPSSGVARALNRGRTQPEIRRSPHFASPHTVTGSVPLGSSYRL